MKIHWSTFIGGLRGDRIYIVAECHVGKRVLRVRSHVYARWPQEKCIEVLEGISHEIQSVAKFWGAEPKERPL